MAKITALLFTILAIQAVEMSDLLPDPTTNDVVIGIPSNTRENTFGDFNTLITFLDTVVELLKDESKTEDDKAFKEVEEMLGNIRAILANSATKAEKIVAKLSKLPALFDNDVNPVEDVKKAREEALDFFQNIRHELRSALYQNSDNIAKQIKVVAGLLTTSLQNDLLSDQIAPRAFCLYTFDLETIVDLLLDVAQNESGVIDKSVPTILENVKNATESLKTICTHPDESNNAENELSLRKDLQDISSEFLLLVEKQFDQLPEGAVQDTFKTALIKYITVSYNFLEQIEDIFAVSAPDQDMIAILAHSQILENDVIAEIQSFKLLTAESNKTIRELGLELTRALDDIAKSFKSYSEEETGNLTGVANKMAEMIKSDFMMLRQVALNTGLYSSATVKLHYLDTVERATATLHQFLYRPEYNKEDKKLVAILSDYLTVLRRQLVTFQSLRQSKMGNQHTYAIVIQIQIVTNNVALYLHDIPLYDESTKTNVHSLKAKMERRFEKIIARLENEVVINSKVKREIFYGVLKNLKNIHAGLSNFSAEANTLFGICHAINAAIQKVAWEFKMLGWFAQPTGEDEGNFDLVTRSVLVEYLIYLRHTQHQVSDMISVIQQNQNPRELGIQILANSRDLNAMLGNVLSDDSQVQPTLLWPTKKFAFALENIKTKLKAQNVDALKTSFTLIQQSLLGARMSTIALDSEIINHLIQVFGISLKSATKEMQNLALGDQNTAFVKSVMHHFLVSLKGYHAELQTNLQLFEGESTSAQVEVSSGKLLDKVLVIELESDDDKFNSILVTVLKELNDIKISLGMIPTDFVKLQEDVQVKKLCNQLSDDILKLVGEIQLLLKKEKAVPQVPNNNISPQFMAAWVLKTFANNLIQLSNVHGRAVQQLNNQERAAEIQTITDQLPSSIERVVETKKEAAQGLVIEAIIYAHHIESIVEKLENELKSAITKNDALQKATTSFKAIPSALRQVYSAWKTKSASELKTVIIAQTQSFNTEIKKLLEAKLDDSILGGVLVDYLDAIKQLKIGTGILHSTNKQVLISSIRYIRDQITLTTIHIMVDDDSFNKSRTFNVKASQTEDVYKMLTKLTNKIENQSILNEFVEPLKEVQALVQQLIDGSKDVTKSFFRAVEFLQKASYHIVKMNSDAQLALYREKNETLLKEVLTDFLIFQQELDITLTILFE